MPTHEVTPVWLFAYGSLLWRPDFAFVDVARGYVRGWSRRFWQGSHDHRGVPQAPGRVVTLTPMPAELCWGLAYRLDDATQESTLQALDLREQGGYERHVVEFHASAPALNGSVPALVYLAGPNNADYLGPAPLPDIAEQIRQAQGPSGTNLDYLLQLSASLGALGIQDAHVDELMSLLHRSAPPSNPGPGHASANPCGTQAEPA